MASNKKYDENENSDRNANDINQTEGPDAGKTEKSFVLGVFRLIEQIILFIVVLMTMGAAIVVPKLWSFGCRFYRVDCRLRRFVL